MTCSRHLDHRARRWQARSDSPLPFALPGAPRRFARDREVDLRHVALDLRVDFATRSLSGTATHFLTPLRPGVRSLTLDAVDMDIEFVKLGSSLVPFRHDGEKLVIDLGTPMKEGRESKLTIAYACTPRRGFYFIAPDETRPDRVVHAWSQGQDEDSRHWWPVHDYPNEKATTEVIATVPADMVALSNGRLVSTRKRAGRQQSWHWKHDVPHVPYLVTLVVGPFEKLEQAGPAPMTTYFLPGRRADAQRVVRDTPRMVKLFAQLTGVKYPYDKYDQVFVQDFIFGGMENTSISTLTDLVLHDRRAALDYSAEDLVSHELAHQWWGNLVTCRDWSQGWLNEGFATYFECIWREHAHGPEDAWQHQADHRESYLEEQGGSYQRPIACRSYHDPIELFDAHLYEKGGWVVGMLREELGDELFWRSLRTYLEDNRAGSVETDDLRRAVEKASGRNFERFFEQWVESPGHPELEIETSWDSERRELSLSVEQSQSGDGVPACFHLTLPLLFLGSPSDDAPAGPWSPGVAKLTQRRQTFVFAMAEEPRAVVVDPWDRVLKTVTWKRPVAQLVAVLESAPFAPARAEAATALGKDGSGRAVAALAKAVCHDAFWGVSVSAAAALGVARSEAALDSLLAALETPHPKVRRAVVAAVGRFRDPRAFAALRDLSARGDASYFVEAEALRSIGRTRQLDALRILREAIARPESTWNETVRVGALEALGELGLDQRDEAVDILLPWTSAQRFVRCRQAAVKALCKLGEGSPRVRESLERMLEDPEFRVVVAAADALSDVGTSRSGAALSRLIATSLEGRSRRSAQDALRRIARREEAPSSQLRADLEEAQAELRRLAERVEKLEGRKDGG